MVKESPQRLGDGKRLTMKELARHQEVPYIRHAKTWSSWAREGVFVNGERQRIPHVDVNGTLYTTLEAVREFFAKAESNLPRFSDRGPQR